MILTRNNLTVWAKNKPIQDITCLDFKSEFRDKIEEAHYVVFADDNAHKVLKDRFGTFYCAEWDNVGYVCEDGQCDKCKRAENM